MPNTHRRAPGQAVSVAGDCHANGVAGAALLGLLLAWPATGAHVPCDRRQAEEALNRFDEAVSALSENAQERFLERHARELDALEAAEASEDWERICRLLAALKVPANE